MTTLSTEQVAHLTTMMDERFAQELDEIRAVATRSRDERAQEALTGTLADRADQVLSEIATAADYAIVRQDIEDVRDIVAARRRLASGHYGVCVDCGEAIAYERLLAYPTAKRCIACQREYERRHAV